MIVCYHFRRSNDRPRKIQGCVLLSIEIFPRKHLMNTILLSLISHTQKGSASLHDYTILPDKQTEGRGLNTLTEIHSVIIPRLQQPSTWQFRERTM